ncbi:Uncharacterized protein Rs2_45374 [Raphanus sativus]|uniref:Uncharacterized protein LOC108842264 n=1 Tax=Raphanus sativus TaxID=3726 RepID=A0A6J0MEU2_RAPSA|nr:uncharacterized protein LOC108842264 [Raphanus sativus]KAJ4872965.1 Uncharacterized protein Rs2_45374 [Raphanus sativus]
MSRCFPFPPPGYVLNGSRDEALIESIKRAEEKAKKEQRRKERKREKKDNKDKKKEKKDKKTKERERSEGGSEKHSHKRRRKEEGAKEGNKVRKLNESENGSFEKSSLTVERDLLQSTSQNSCDSTLNSNELPKQHKEKQPHHDSESIIRIRLPIRRQNDPEVMMSTNKDQQKPCLSREVKLDTANIVTRKQPQQRPCCTSKPHEEKRKDQILRTKLGKEKKLSSTSDDPSSGLCRFCPPSLAVQFLNVVENWVPNTIQRSVELTNTEGDECWWFLKKPSSHKFDGTERCKQLNSETKQVVSSSMAWPCARLLPEADVHALPYTVPF